LRGKDLLWESSWLLEPRLLRKSAGLLPEILLRNSRLLKWSGGLLKRWLLLVGCRLLSSSRLNGGYGDLTSLRRLHRRTG
jgi:hypothetical protein